MHENVSMHEIAPKCTTNKYGESAWRQWGTANYRPGMRLYVGPGMRLLAPAKKWVHRSRGLLLMLPHLLLRQFEHRLDVQPLEATLV